MTTAPLTNTLACVTISNPEPERQAELMRLIGWQQAAEGAIDASLETVWGITPGSAGKRFSLWHAPGSDWGMVRVVEGLDRYPTRQIGARWSGIEIIVMKDIDGLYQKLEKSGLFKVFVPPRNYDFTHVGSNIHRAMVGRMPGGTHIVFTMAVTAPKGRAFPSSPNDVGHIFAVHLVARDFPRSFAFYREDLGMVPYLQDHLEGGLWHETWSLPDGTPVELGTVRGNVPGTGRGAIEMQGYDNAMVDPIAITRDRLDGGSCIATYTADDIDATFAVVKANAQATVLSQPTAMAGAPYGGGRAFCFLGPSGERFEVAERFPAVKIAIVGCGAMGSVYAGLLASAGNEVWAIGRPGAHLDAIARAGLRVTGASGDRSVRLAVTTQPADAGVCDLVVLATKGPDLQAAARSAAPMVSGGTVVLATQNGLGGPEMAAAALPDAHVAVGVAAGFGAALPAPGHVHHNGWGEMRLGERSGVVTPALARVADVWRAAGFVAPSFDDTDRMVWEKLCINVSFDAVGTLHDMVIGDILSDADAWALSQACLAEAVAVARARGIALGFADLAAHVRAFGAKIPQAMPSMLLDHRARRRSEIDALNGAVARLAQEMGIAAPANERVTRAIKGRETGF